MSPLKKRKPTTQQERWWVRLAATVVGAALLAVVFFHWYMTSFKFDTHDWVMVPFILGIALCLMFPSRAATIVALVRRKR